MRFFVLGLIVVFMSCKSSNKLITPKDIENFKRKIEHQNIKVTSNFAQPLGINSGVMGLENLLPPGSTIGNINLSGSSNFFIIKKDSLEMDLPYYGQQRMSRGYNTSGSVEFSGKVASVKKEFIEKRNQYIFKYKVNTNTEMYNIVLTLHPNSSSNLVVNSSHRTTISYRGNWEELKKEKE
ncbi:hypothetical protein DIS07_13510 [Polaribacter aquimarinus]|uniref:DUF4251 domain-containing protein n=2 Tax=Polaribacter aquimarinus TaxID=2100726 RepID=A0A2U2J7V0_9FLAO|nr:hypothetical protein DIS07_13510 [Polaribacter aquimarinus]